MVIVNQTTVGPVWNGGSHHEAEKLDSCYRRSLEVAMENNIRTIAFPSISTGAYRFPVDKAAQIAVDTVEKFIEDHPGQFDLVEWVLFDDRTFKEYESWINGTGQG